MSRVWFYQSNFKGEELSSDIFSNEGGWVTKINDWVYQIQRLEIYWNQIKISQVQLFYTFASLNIPNAGYGCDSYKICVVRSHSVLR